MASELVRNVWCDVHAVDTDERVAVPSEGEGVRFAIGNLSGVVDLCADCITQNVVPLAEWLERYAHPEDTTPPKTDKKAPPSRFVCETCGASYGWQATLRAHERDVHGRTLEALGGDPVNCPHCGRHMGSKAGLGAHVKYAHPDKFVKKKLN